MARGPVGHPEARVRQPRVEDTPQLSVLFSDEEDAQRGRPFLTLDNAGLPRNLQELHILLQIMCKYRIYRPAVERQRGAPTAGHLLC